MAVIDFNTLYAINQLLKERNIPCSLHSVGGCASCGLALEKEDDTYSSEEIVAVINQFLKSKWLKVVISDDDVNHFDVLDTF